MGAGQSISRGFPSRELYKKKVVPAHFVVNDIFRWMLNEVEFHDLLDLTSQQKCQSYIFLTKRALATFFHEIQLEPKLSKEDSLYFQSVKHLQYGDEKTRKSYPDELALRDTLCRQLAFFYVRIFQVFGALALTVFDGLPELGSTAAAIAPALHGQVRPPLFGRGGEAQQQGGAYVEPVTDAFEIGEEMFALAHGMVYRIHGEARSYLITEEAITRTTPVDIRTDVGRVFYRPSENLMAFRLQRNRTLYATVQVSRSGDTYVFNLKQYSTTGPTSDLVSSRVERTFTRDMFGTYTQRNQKFPSVLKTIFTHLLQPAADGRKRDGVVGWDGVGWDGAVDAPRGRRRTVLGEQRRGWPAAAGPAGTDTATTGLSWERLYGILEGKQQQPKAYCVARAIQLLSPTFLESTAMPQGPTSRICFFSKIPGLEEALPQYERPIREHNPGIRALEQLFYDMIDGNMPKISDVVKPKYVQFVKLLQDIYAPEGRQDVKGGIETLDRVVSYPFPQCKQKRDQTIPVRDQDTLRKVRAQVAELLQTQVVHTANVMTFFQTMFLFDKGGQVTGIHPVLQKGGIAAVNVLAEKARILLINYYKQCEVHYRLGAAVIVKGI